mmetsp:Transcript_21056/g.81524  ORF Transcript_21056/g.81524 Transcript_21056/m.81524 type:complete len:271 (+) Transcript_21056:8861-9673(+)
MPAVVVRRQQRPARAPAGPGRSGPVDAHRPLGGLPVTGGDERLGDPGRGVAAAAEDEPGFGLHRLRRADREDAAQHRDARRRRPRDDDGLARLLPGDGRSAPGAADGAVTAQDGAGRLHPAGAGLRHLRAEGAGRGELCAIRAVLRGLLVPARALARLHHPRCALRLGVRRKPATQQLRSADRAEQRLRRHAAELRDGDDVSCASQLVGHCTRLGGRSRGRRASGLGQRDQGSRSSRQQGFKHADQRRQEVARATDLHQSSLNRGSGSSS